MGEHTREQFERWARRVGRDKQLDPVARSVLQVLATYANQRTGVAWPSQDTLADDTGWSVRAVRNALKTIERAGVLELERCPGHATRWRFPLEATPAPPAGVDHRTPAPPAGVTPAPPAATPAPPAETPAPPAGESLRTREESATGETRNPLARGPVPPDVMTQWRANLGPVTPRADPRSVSPPSVGRRDCVPAAGPPGDHP
jgi:hypothetical protein